MAASKPVTVTSETFAKLLEYKRCLELVVEEFEEYQYDEICDLLTCIDPDFCGKNCGSIDKIECYLKWAEVLSTDTLCRCENERPFWDQWDMYMGDLGNGEHCANRTFVVRGYDWKNDRNNKWHFWHKPSGVKVAWYKYPLRDMEINKPITAKEFGEILKDCRNSMVDTPTYEVDKWWRIEPLPQKLK